MLLLPLAVFTYSTAEAKGFRQSAYVRLDLGAAMPNNFKSTSFDYNTKGITDGVRTDSGVENRAYYRGKTKWGNTIALGVGMNITPKLRSDITFSYGPSSKYTGQFKRSYETSGKLPQDNITGVWQSPYSIITNTKQRIKAMQFMWNGYYDIPTGSFVTPYVMGGIGMTRLKPKKYEMVDSVDNPEVRSQAGAITSVPSLVGRSVNNFTWALGFGVAVQVTEKLSVDFAYRFTHFGRITTVIDPKYKAYALEENPLNVNLPNEFTSKFRTNQLSIGARWDF